MSREKSFNANWGPEWGWSDELSNWEERVVRGTATFPAVAADTFRHVMGHFATGVTVLTTIVDGRPVGMTAQSFVSLSLDPPLVMVCPSRSSSSWKQIAKAGNLCINVLSRDQEDISRKFAAKSRERFDGVRWSPAPSTLSPLLEGVHAWVDCLLEDQYPGGDHWIAVCRVLAVGAHDQGGDPLIFYGGRYGDARVTGRAPDLT